MASKEMITRSIALVAALRLRGIEPESVGRDGAGKALFYFGRTDDLTEAVNSSYNDTMFVSARGLASAMHDVRVAHIGGR